MATATAEKPTETKNNAPVPWFKKFGVFDVTLFASQGIAAYSVLSALNNNTSYFALHPRMAIAGFLAATTGAWVMVNKKKAHVSRPMQLHQCLMGISTGLVSFAFYRIWTNKDKFNKPHLQTKHAYLGAASTGLLIVLNAFTMKLTYSKQSEFEWKLHRVLARVCISLFGGAVVTGSMTAFNNKDGSVSNTTMQAIGGTVGAIASIGLAAMMGA